MEAWAFILILLIIGQRLIELVIANRNEKWIKKKGGYEVGSEHYKWFVVTHTLFFLSLFLECFFSAEGQSFSVIWFLVFLLTQVMRIWCITSLGRFWNTKILILPGGNRVNKGPYKLLKHPNYLIVGIELFVIPFMIQAYVTAIIFPLLHLLLMSKRLPIENNALNDLMLEKK